MTRSPLVVTWIVVLGSVCQASADEAAPLPERYAEAVLQVEGMI